MDREQRTIKAIAEAIARGECPPRTTPREWTHFEKQAKAVFYDLVLTVQLHDDDDESPAKVGGDEREALPASVHEALAFYADSTVDYITFDKTRRQAQLDARRNSPDWEEIGEDGRGHERFVVTGNKASTALEDLERWEESRTALSADGGEESPSLTNPLTPYGMLVRALRIVADTTLMEMSQRCGMTPSYLSALEFGRKAVTNDDATSAAVFFASKGIAGTLGLLQAAIAANQAKGDAS